MNMPSEEERGVTTERHCSYKGIPCGLPEELDKWYYLEEKRETKAYSWGDLWEHCKRRISDQTSSDTLECFRFDRQS